jgi:hypothetical protein
MWAEEVDESPVREAITEGQAAIPYDLTKSNAKRFSEAKTIEDLPGRCFLTPHATEFYWKESASGAPAAVKVCRCVQGLDRDIGNRNKEDLAMWMPDLTAQVDKASAVICAPRLVAELFRSNQATKSVASDNYDSEWQHSLVITRFRVLSAAHTSRTDFTLLRMTGKNFLPHDALSA